MRLIRRPAQLAATLLLGLAMLRGASLRAQGATDGAMHGRIEDDQHRGVALATITVRALDVSEYRSAAALRDGTFLLAQLAPGRYEVTITAPGLIDAVYEPVEVRPDETLELRATLRADKASSILLHERLPDRETDEVPDQDDDGLVSLHGLATLQLAATVDGATATQSYSSAAVGAGGDPAPDPEGDQDSAEFSTGPANGLSRGRHAGAAYTFSQSAVRAFHVTGDRYSAQTGSSGGVATTVSRSGSNTLHGSVTAVLRSQLFAATSPLSIATSYADGVVSSAVVKPHDLRENFAATLGGPVPRTDDLFFFYAFDGQRRGFPAISSPGDPNFYNLTAMQRALLANRGVTGAALDTALNNLSALTGEAPRRADQTLNFIRLDWNQHPRYKLALQYNEVRWTSPAGLVDAPVVARGRASLGSAAGSLDQVLLRATTLLTSHTGNEAHVAFTHDVQYESPQTPLPQEPAISPEGLAPEVNIGPNGILLGTPASLSQQAYPNERRLELGDTVTMVRGHHLLEAGASVSFVHEQVATLVNAAGTFRYDSGVARGFAGGLADYLSDATFNVNTTPNGACPAITAAAHLFCFRSFSQSFGVDASAFATQEWAAFAEDRWRLRRSLTLHAGARYEYTLLPIPQNPNATLDAIFGAKGATGVFPEDRNNLGPRASLAWEPLGAGHGTVRLGYGVFFGRLPGATIRAALSDTALAGGTTRIRIRPNASVPCPQVPGQGFGYPCAFVAPPSGAVAQTTSAVVFDRRFRLPVVQQGSLSLERTFARATSVTASYVLNLDRQLPSSTDINIAPSNQSAKFQLQGGTGVPGVTDGEVFVLPVYTARLTPSFGPVTDVVSNVNASYHALVLAADSNPLRTLQLRAAYTWSKAIDFGQALSGIPRSDGQFDPFSNGYDKGLSALNYPWALRATGVWTPRVAMRQRVMRAVLHDWQFDPVVTARAGRPYSYDLSGGTYLPGGHESLNGSGGALYLPTVGRNTLRLPSVVNVDLRVAREFHPRLSTHRLDLRGSAEAFNLFNHRNVSSVTQRAYLVGTPVNGVTPLVFQSAAAIAAEGLNTQAFGTPTAASTSLNRERQVQVSVRVQF